MPMSPHDNDLDNDTARDLALDHHVTWCKDNPLERALREELAHWDSVDPDHMRKALDRLGVR